MAAGETTIGKLLVRLLMDKTQFDAATKGATNQIRDLGARLDRLGSTVSDTVTTAFKGAAAAAASFAAGSAIVGANFEYALKRVSVVALDGRENIQLLEDQARKLGKTTAFSATQAAEAMLALAQAGLRSADIIAASEAAVHLAGATGAEMDQATELIAATLSQFQLGATESTRIVDVFSKAMSNSLLSMDSLAYAMRYAGTTGAGFGYSLEETTAALAQFRDLGLQGMKAGTAFRQMMTMAAAPSEKAAKTLAKYNLSIQDINPSLHGFAEILGSLGEAGLTTADALEIFGQEVGANVATLADKFANGTSTYEELLGLLRDSAGSTEAMYADMMDTVRGQFAIVLSAAEEATLTLFEQFAVPLRDFLSALAETVQHVVDVFQRQTGEMGAGFASVFADMAEWLRANEGLLAQLFMQFVSGLQIAGRLIVQLAPLVDELAAGMVVAFAAQKVYAFVTAVQSSVTAIRALVAGLRAAAAAGAIATGGMTAVVAAVVAVVAAVATMSVAFGEAEAAADRLAAAEQRLTEETEARETAMLRASETLLTATQDRLRAYLAEHEALGDLDDAELQRIRRTLEMTGAQAKAGVEAGKLVAVNGELLSVEDLINERGNEGLDLVEQRVAAYRREADEHARSRDQMSQALAQYKSQVDVGTSAQLAFAGVLQRYGGTVEEVEARIQGMDRAEQAASDRAKALADERANVVSRITAEATAEGKRTAAEAESQNSDTLDKMVSDRESAAEKTLEIERALAADLAAVGDNRAADTRRELDERLRAVEEAYAAELKLYTSGSAAYLAVAARQAQALADVRLLSARRVAEELSKLTEEERAASEELYRDEAMSAADAADKRVSEIEALVAAEAQLYDAGSAEMADLEQRRQEALAAVRDHFLAEQEQRDLEAARERLGKIEALEEDLARTRASRLGAIEMERSRALLALGQASAEERARVDAVFDARAAEAQIEAHRAAEEEIEGLSRRRVSRVVELERQRAQAELQIVDASAEDRERVEAAYDRAINRARRQDFAETWKRVAEGGKAAAESVATAFGKVRDVVSGIASAALGAFGSLTGLSVDLMGSVGELTGQGQDAAAAGQTFDLSGAASSLVAGLVQGAAATVSTLVGAVPVLVGELAAAIPGLVKQVAEALPVVAEALGDGLVSLVGGLSSALPAFVSGIAQALPLLIDGIAQALPTLIGTLMALIPRLVRTVLAEIPSAVELLVGGIVQILLGIPRIVEAVLDAVPTIILSLVEGIPQIITAVLGLIPVLIEQVIAHLPDILGTLIEGVLQIVVDLAAELPVLITRLIELVPELIEAVLALLPRLIMAILDAVPAILLALVRGLPLIIEAVISLIPELVTALVTYLPQIALALVGSLFELIFLQLPVIIFELVTGILQGLVDGAVSIGKAIAEAVRAAIGLGKDVKEDGVGKSAKKLGENLRGYFAAGINYVPQTMPVLLHRGEMVTPADENPNRPGGGSSPSTSPSSPSFVPSAGRGGSSAPVRVEMAVVLNDRVVDAVTSEAIDGGRAPKLTRKFSKAAGVVQGYSRGKFNAWSR